MPIPGKPTTPAVKERLAINLPDLDRIDPFVRQQALAGKLDLEAGPIRVDPEDVRETAVGFLCPMLTAALVCDVLRHECRKLGDPVVRVYLQGPKGGWRKLPEAAVLTKVDERCKVVLNLDDVFTEANPQIVSGPSLKKPVKVF